MTLTTEFEVHDASCGHCKATIEAAVVGLGDGIVADLDLTTKRLAIQHGESIDKEDVARAIQKAGYTPQLVS
jgi:copper chaperone